MKLNVFAFLVCTTLTAFSQVDITWQSSFDVGSRWLRQDFFLSFYKGKFLDSTLKQKALKHLGNFNSLGFLEYSNVKIDFLSNDTAKWYLSFHQQIGASVEFNKHLFELIFIGNKNLEDSVFSLNPTSYYYSNLLAIGGGKYFRKGHFAWSLGASLNGIFNYQKGDFTRSKLAFSSNFDTIKACIDVTMEKPLSSAVLRGIGLGLDASISWKVNQEEAFIGIYNLGSALLFKQHMTTYQDSLLKFYGFTFDDLKAFANQEDSFPSSIDQILTLSRDTAPRWRMLPFQIQSAFQETMNKQVFIVRTFYIAIPAFIPEIFLSYYWHPTEWLYVGPMVKYGGFNGFCAGIVSQAKINSHWMIEFNLPAISQIIAPSSYVGYKAFLKLNYVWKKQ